MLYSPPQQTKRKLDDANKRLEALYDKLREQTVSAALTDFFVSHFASFRSHLASVCSLQLSPAIVGGLHNIARTIESRSYMEGLNIHTHIVSNSNFSETSAFMPVLKVVLTQANKLGVWSDGSESSLLSSLQLKDTAGHLFSWEDDEELWDVWNFC